MALFRGNEIFYMADPLPLLTHVALPFAAISVFVVAVFLVSFHRKTQRLLEPLTRYLKFCYSCFIKPHGEVGRDQQLALESFYQAQASIYDTTRSALLHGREDMLALVAAQLQQRQTANILPHKPVWIDVGGGTGYNIEQMSRFVDVPNFFAAVYLVDLSPSLTAVALARFLRLGWRNVHVVCQDARHFRLPDHMATVPGGAPTATKPDLITLSYALSMIPEWYAVIDTLASNLAPHGVIGVADFYVQSEAEFAGRTHIGGARHRHCSWLARLFWRSWFEADRVHLDAARRDYLEYRFGTVLGFNERCRILGFRIPYYVWVGCPRGETTPSVGRGARDTVNGASPFIDALDLHALNLEEARDRSAKEILAVAQGAEIVDLAASVPFPATWYQQHRWRLYYDEALPEHQQFGEEYIYAFTWEDVEEDIRLLSIKNEDNILAITSAGDNVLAYALQQPRRIHAVDLNPNQNHLLELKLAAFTALGYDDVWALFGEGHHIKFRELLISQLSPHLSSLAFQYWLHHGPHIFGKCGLYRSGGSRHALNLVRWLAHIFGLKPAISQLCQATTLEEQKQIWRLKLRPLLLSRWLSRLILSNKTWLWRALGVPEPQRAMIELDHVENIAAQSLSPQKRPVPATFKNSRHLSSPLLNGGAIWAYCVQTLDPVAQQTHLRTSNPYYLLSLLGKYTHESHPAYLDSKAYSTLVKHASLNSSLRIHTAAVRTVLLRLAPGSITIAVLMDSLDWFDGSRRSGQESAAEQVRLLRRALSDGGRVLLRSAGVEPWYIRIFENGGFDVKRVALREPGKCIDRVNMYASTWICTRRAMSPRVARLVGKEESMEPLSIGSPGLDL